MTPGLFIVIILVSAFWFPIYWLFGGVVFAAITLMNSIKLRKVRFSVFFTLLSMSTAVLASFFGTYLVRTFAHECVVRQSTFVDTFAGVVGCGILEFVAAGFIGFLVLIGMGSILLVLSRATNQSWVDSDHGLDETGEVTFDHF